MGLYFRKSVNLGGGIRLNFSKSGIGLSGGVKGARISTGPRGTYMNLFIPGTGIGYRTRLGGSNTSYRSASSSSRYPYQKTIVNEYTGETRTVRASTQWELNEQVRNTEIRMQNNELRARRNAEIASQKEKAEQLTNDVKQVQNSFKNIIAATIKVNDRLDWNKQLRNEVYPEFSFSEPKPTKKKIGILSGIFGKTDNYEDRLKSYEKSKTKALQDYFNAKQEFEAEQRQHNADVNFLRESFKMCEEGAIEKYASVVLANSQYPSELDMDFDVDYVGNENTIYVSFLLPDISDFPLIDRYSFNQSTNEIKEYPLSKASATLLYENTLLAVGIRTIHEMFEAIYNGAIETVVFKGYLLSSETTEDTTDFTDNVREIFEIKAEKNFFESIAISDDNIADTLAQLDFKRVRDFTNPSENLQGGI